MIHLESGYRLVCLFSNILNYGCLSVLKNILFIVIIQEDYSKVFEEKKAEFEAKVTELYDKLAAEIKVCL